MMSITSTSTAFASEQGQITPLKEDEGSTNAKVIHLEKPIASKSFISNKDLGKFLDKRHKDVKWLEILNGVGDLINAPGTAINGLALSFANGNGLTQMEKAHAQGKGLYWAEVYADGNEGSLSKQAHVYYSKKSL